jgi:hypothetical protein
MIKYIVVFRLNDISVRYFSVFCDVETQRLNIFDTKLMFQMDTRKKKN